MCALQRRPDGLSGKALAKAPADQYAGQRTERIVFIPWAMPDAQEWVSKTAQWNVAKGDQFTVVCFDPAVSKHPALRAANSNPRAMIYIRGHGNPGAPYIQVKLNGGVTTQNLPIKDACQRLIASGLKSGYPGVIKFYSCHSGTKLIAESLENDNALVKSANDTLKQGVKDKNITKQQAKQWERVAAKDQSMGGQGADYFRSKGFKHCSFYGYLGPLGSEYDLDDTNAWHKVVALDGLHDGPAHLADQASCRPSVARIRV